MYENNTGGGSDENFQIKKKLYDTIKMIGSITIL